MTISLYDDDDDFISDDGANKDGDTGENVDSPDIGMLQSNDTPCQDNYITDDCNSLAPAFITPTYDLGTHTNEVTFDLHTTATEFQTLVTGSDFGQRATHTNIDFWTIYLLGGYQGDEDEDGDPNDIRINPTQVLYTQGVTGRVDAINGSGLIIYMEQDRPYELSQVNLNNWQTRPLAQRFNVVHEVGHLFGLSHEDYDTMNDAWVMAQSPNRNRAIYNAVQIDKIRSIANP